MLVSLHPFHEPRYLVGLYQRCNLIFLATSFANQTVQYATREFRALRLKAGGCCMSLGDLNSVGTNSSFLPIERLPITGIPESIK
jgi:hypothetical protein